MCSNGPPCVPGKTAASIRVDNFFSFPDLNFIPNGLSKSFPIIIIPPLGPRRVLCVVEVITWQCFKGSFKILLAIKPDGWEISANSRASISSLIDLKTL